MSDTQPTAKLEPQQPLGERITWARLCELEPRLLDLYKRAKAINDDRSKPSFCANRIWRGVERQDGGLRREMYELVGYGAPDGADPRLRTGMAWRVAQHKIYGALPDCRDCVCWGFQDIIDERLRG